MPHISITNGLPGISGLMAQRPDTAAPLNQLAETLLRSPASSALSRGERELIAAYTSELNGTEFCAQSHSAFAAAQLDGGAELVKAVLHGLDEAPVTPKLRALLRIAGAVRGPVRALPAELVAEARAAGADDGQIHDTVLIAAAFCLFNRYVTCLDTELPADPGYYEEGAERIVARGYAPAAG
ncbi:putative peroxidase-related enzyme [Kitasatospora sp. SolWspMP-SS2h]|uniref:carboxymuconolactone decarboxylase family protein n=1 Tax=Kitasatospora sp. SolWspMP-SS2h TaxID=1305729 RepID=UPI000DB92797|nr:carboxymuconolactone decarboxylase family protein [Kitasatospora sp. SolWspMP-SS2h]RAJ45416.1 putative peroxidase-related enzyme [Kitasatospora sp. SolWspMP-SS2h]